MGHFAGTTRYETQHLDCEQVFAHQRDLADGVWFAGIRGWRNSPVVARTRKTGHFFRFVFAARFSLREKSANSLG
jgi:hypothetical protein